MPSIFPSETPQWGWVVLNLNCPDLKNTMAFYEKLGFDQFGGEVDKNWAMLRNGLVEIHLFQGFIKMDMLNYRGGDFAGIRAALDAAELKEIATQGPQSFTLQDPDGRHVFFDIGEPEVSQLKAGQILTIPLPDGQELDQRRLDLGNFSWCLSCKELSTTANFYSKLGFQSSGGMPSQGWQILARADHQPTPKRRVQTVHLSLFQGMIPEDTLNFRGGNVSEIADQLAAQGIDLKDGVKVAEDGGESLLITDPDGRPVFFDTTPPERLYSG